MGVVSGWRTPPGGHLSRPRKEDNFFGGTRGSLASARGVGDGFCVLNVAFRLLAVPIPGTSTGTGPGRLRTAADGAGLMIACGEPEEGEPEEEELLEVDRRDSNTICRRRGFCKKREGEGGWGEGLDFT